MDVGGIFMETRTQIAPNNVQTIFAFSDCGSEGNDQREGQNAVHRIDVRFIGGFELYSPYHPTQAFSQGEFRSDWQRRRGRFENQIRVW